MSDENEGPPPLSPQLHEFYEEHAKTGEPTQAELGRALLKLHGATRPTRFSVAGRRLLPPEVLAVAAVLILSVGGAFIGWRVRSANAQTAALISAKAAWVRGDLEAASAALEACSTAECARLAAAVKRAKVQSENVGALDEAEAGSLLALDRELSDGAHSVIAERLEKKSAPADSDRVFAESQFPVLVGAGVPMHVVSLAVSDFIQGARETSPSVAQALLSNVVRLVPDTELARAAQKKLAALEAAPASLQTAPAPLTPELTALLERAKVAKQERRHDEAISVLEKCLHDVPDQPDCLVSLASTFATRGNQINNASDNARARELYSRFLMVADPTDKRIARVREILSPPEQPRRHEPDMDPLNEYQVTDFAVASELGRIMELEKTDRAAAILAYEELLRVAPRASMAGIVQLKLKELGSSGSPPKSPAAAVTEAAALYARGLAIKDTDPDEARALFEAAIASAPTSMEASKATVRVQLLDDRKKASRKRLLEAQDTYLRGYQLKDTNPTQAREAFQQVIELAPDSVESAKAQARLDELDEAETTQLIKAAPKPSKNLTLTAGERRVLTIKELERVAIEDAAIADIISSGADDFEVVGVGAGVTTMVTWHDGKQTTWRVTVTGSLGRMGQLKIASNPSGADVLLDGKSTGRRTPVTPAEPLEVPVGRHTIQFEWNEKRSAVQTIDVVEGMNPVIRGDIPR
ncbi:MAG: tetratricopeptide repeat protein [Myxococcales bacterium]|nr:tetratricopeptide repeat protein [Myxococcales bacterium]